MSKQKHLSRLAAPRTWPIERKKTKWITRPVPGTHKIIESMPLQVYLTDILDLVKTRAEVKRVLSEGLVLVNGKAVKEVRFPVGLFDTLQILKYNKCYRVLVSNIGQLKLAEIPASEAHIVVAKVKGKTTVKGNKTQVSLSNGWTFLAEKDAYKVGDSIFFDVKTNKPAKHIKLEEGSVVYIAGGKHAGNVVKIEKFVEEGILRKKKYLLATLDSTPLKIPVNEVYAVGKGKAEITLS